GMLEAASFVTVPWCSGGETLGRLCLTASRWYAFDLTDVHFLLQVLGHVMPTMENIRLVDQLASTAAEMERQRVGRNLHDSVIQPYIALRMALVAIYQKLPPGSTTLVGDLQEVFKLIDLGIADLRRYAGGLQRSNASPSSLLPVLHRFAE